MANRTAFTQSFMLEDIRARLFAMALGARLVQAGPLPVRRRVCGYLRRAGRGIVRSSSGLPALDDVAAN
jgi:hypothetical protein